MSACAQRIDGKVPKRNPRLRRPPNPRCEQERSCKGYSRLPHAWFADIGRLARGKAQLLLLLYGWRQSEGRERRRGEAAPEWTNNLSIEDLAAIASCSEREVQADLSDAADRGMIEMKRVGKGLVQFRVVPKKWRDLIDYKPFPIDKPAADDEGDGDEEGEETPAAIAKSATRIVRHPVSVAPNKATRAIPVNCGVKSIRLQNTSTVRLGFDIVVQAGEMLVITQPPPETKPLQFTGRTSSINDIASGTRSTLRGNGTVGEKVADLRSVLQPIWKRHFPTLELKADLLSKTAAILQDAPLEFSAPTIRKAFSRDGYKYETGLLLIVAREIGEAWQGQVGEDWRGQQNRHINEKFGGSEPANTEMTARQAHTFIRAHEGGEHVDADLLAEARRALAKEEVPC